MQPQVRRNCAPGGQSCTGKENMLLGTVEKKAFSVELGIYFYFTFQTKSIISTHKSLIVKYRLQTGSPESMNSAWSWPGRSVLMLTMTTKVDIWQGYVATKCPLQWACCRWQTTLTPDPEYPGMWATGSGSIRPAHSLAGTSPRTSKVWHDVDNIVKLKVPL